MSQSISGPFTTSTNIIPGYSVVLDPVTYVFVSDPSKPSTFVIIFKDKGYEPTGNNIHAYKVGNPNVELTLVGNPVIDYINQTLTLVVAGFQLQTNDQIIIIFEAEEI